MWHCLSGSGLILPNGKNSVPNMAETIEDPSQTIQAIDVFLGYTPELDRPSC